MRLIEHWEILVGMVTTFFAYLGGKKIKAIEEKKAGSDAVASMQVVYDSFVKDIDERYKQMKAEHVDMKQEMLTLKTEVVQLRKENHELRKEVVVLRNENAQLRKDLNNAN